MTFINRVNRCFMLVSEDFPYPTTLLCGFCLKKNKTFALMNEFLFWKN